MEHPPVPVTAKLSRKFYEAFGDESANELVEWFNAVDATYRADIRELNELNFQRFDAKLEQRIAELHAKLERRIAQLDSKLEQRLSELRVSLVQGLADLRADFQRDLGQTQTALTRWMFVQWMGTLVPLAGLIVYLTR
ncbi:MAG: hypothetical protein IH965_12240 [Gemmatimonadetes bacterium]|nr:hypothetical protein [Gemmatimonadota bacterium]